MANFINSHFARVQNTLGNRIQRSRIAPRPFNIRTTFNAGRLVPLKWFEVVPGQIATIDLSAAIRSATPKTNPLDDAFVDIVAFYCPYRILWNHWEQFNGANETNAWTETASYSIPKLTTLTDDITIQEQSLLNYLELPIGQQPFGPYISDLPIRAYYEIWNWDYRDENTQSPILYSKGDTASYSGADPTLPNVDVFTQGGTVTYLYSLGKAQAGTTGNSCVMPVNRFHDYFSSALPQPFKQVDTAPVVPIDGTAPVTTGSSYIPGTDFDLPAPMKMYTTSSSPSPATSGTGLFVGSGGNVNDGATLNGYSASQFVAPGNLMANLSKGDTTFSLLDMRKAIVMLHVYEQLARGGSRYDEMLKGIWDVDIRDSHIQRPQYLGGIRQPLSFFSVMNTAGSADGDETASSLGTVGAYSLSALNSPLFRQAFNEYGIVMILLCVRNSESYSQGLDKKWTRSEFFDLPLPEMAGVGDQAIYDYEVYSDEDTDMESPTVFGYQERFGELKEFYSRNVGFMDPKSSNGIGSTWTYGNSFSTAPSLATFIPAQGSNIGRVMQVSPNSSGFTFYGDFRFKCEFILPFPVHEQPGLTRI